MGWFGFGRKKKASETETQPPKAEKPREEVPEATEASLNDWDEELRDMMADQNPEDDEEFDERLVQASFNAGELLFEIEEYEEAAEHLFEAAACGHARAQYYLGEMANNGWGVPENEIVAAEWYGQAAAQGDTDAMYALGLLYDTGSELSRDSREAARWYRLAADRNHAGAWHALGGMYRIGTIGEDADEQKALECWRKAGELGHMVAQNDLGDHFRDAGNTAESVRWFRMAAAQGSDYARRALWEMGLPYMEDQKE